MPPAPSTNFMATSRVNPGVSSNGQHTPEGRPPLGVTAAPQLSMEQLSQQLIMEVVAVNSKLEGVLKLHHNNIGKLDRLMISTGHQYFAI
jgi:hypothetical protein